MNFDLSDWEKRQRALASHLEEAARQGIIRKEQIERLALFLLNRGQPENMPTPQTAIVEQGFDTPIARETYQVVEESEAPRFIRGFHDILITIGVVVGLTGIAGLLTVYAVFPAAIVLAEILVRRQRLALPAVALAIAFAAAAAAGVSPILDDTAKWLTVDWRPAVWVAAVFVVTALFYWRYKVPLAFSGLAVAGYATIVLAISALCTKILGLDAFLMRPILLPVFLGLFALAVFLTALRFDFADPARQTRRSDIAFWMHLVAAPALLYTVISFVYLRQGGSWFSPATTLLQVAIVVGSIAVLMLVGIVLDRRAFVTSGLLSLGYAFKILMTQGGLERLLTSTDKFISAILISIGVIVLILGISWLPIRRRVLSLMPAGLVAVVPKVR